MCSCTMVRRPIVPWDSPVTNPCARSQPQVRGDVLAMKCARVKDAIARGYKDVAAGRVIQLETDDQIDAVFANL
jgi:hypothetical protein